MKKLFTLLTLLLFVVSGLKAQEVHSIAFKGGKNVFANEEDASYFSWNKEKHNFNSKFADAKYNEVDYSNGLKMEGATVISWTSTAVSTVVIVQSDWESKSVAHGTPQTIKFDDEELAIADATKGTNCYVYTISDVPAGSHAVKRGSGESGIFLIEVTYTGSTMEQLDAPAITFDSSNGEVTISRVANASKITYTIDGSDPTADSEEYTAPFIAEDGTTVKAIAVGDNASYINSTVASETVILDKVTVATPVFSVLNGTVAITCETANATIEYQLGDGVFVEYTRPFTLTEDATVSARASRGGNVSETVSQAVTTISKGAANRTIWMGYGSFVNNTTNSMTGAEGDDAEGFTMTITGNSEKYWSGADKITIGDVARTSIKLSNGAQNTLTIPEGMSATRITFYSYINSAAARTSYWAEFNGEQFTADVPMGAWNTVEDRLTNPDVRVFPLDGESSVTFTNIGEQLCFIIAIDVVESPDPKMKATSEVALKTVPFNQTATATVTLTGSNLTDGTYDVDMPKVAGLSIEPTSFTVADGAVEQTFTVTYTSEEDVESATAAITFSDGTTTAETAVTYESRATAYEQTLVGEEATWDWTGLKEIVELGAETTPTQNAETLMAEFETMIDFGDSFGDAQAIAVKGIQYPSRKGFAQGSGSIKFKTTVPGYVTLVYSNTGGDNANRWPTINGAQFGDEAIGTAKTTATSPVVPAGEVAIKGTGALRYYTVTFTPAEAPASVNAEITDAGFATFCSLFEVAIPSGLTAYVATTVEENKVTLSPIEGNIPVGTGVVLKGEAGNYDMEVTTTGAELEGTNLLKANLSDGTPSDAEYYTLAVEGTNPVFKLSSGGTLAAGKAYLVIPASDARLFSVVFGEATAISEVKAAAENGTLYNLNGIRVAKAQKGVYIQNGKKVIVK